MSRVVEYAIGESRPSERFGPENIDFGKSPAEQLKERLKISIIEKTDESISFDLVGCDAALANALRRIMIAEVPTIAVEHVYVWDNSSIMHDEVLAHRLGLIPINVDPTKFFFFEDPDDEATDVNTLVFRLDVQCGTEPTAEELEREAAFQGARDPDAPYTKHVYSGDLEFVPQGDQAERFPDGVRPVHDDILIAKLRPGQRIQLELHCRKGIGKDHAKFSPVATASYRLMPRVELAEPLRGEAAEALAAKCPMNVFDIEDSGAVVAARPRDCTMCRECIRSADGEDGRVRLSRVADHFIFSVESVGIIRPEEIVRQAIEGLKTKCETMTDEIERSVGGNDAFRDG